MCKCASTATSSVVTGSCFARRLRSTSPSWSADLGYPAKICQDTFRSRDSIQKKNKLFSVHGTIWGPTCLIHI